MLFCPKCGTILKPKEKAGKKMLWCSCGFTTERKTEEKEVEKKPVEEKRLEIVEELDRHPKVENAPNASTPGENMLELYQKLKESEAFKGTKGYLSHFYCQLDTEYQIKGDCEIGFYDPDEDKIITFVVGEKIEKKPAEDVFKKEQKVEELKLDQVKTKMVEIIETFKKTKEEKYPKEILLSGFLILQRYEGKTNWNISFATKSMQILNVKIDSADGSVISDQMVQFIQQ
jgi:DNA-directed RNA polymerase subunit M/transcription elongation factor TFIIS